MHHDLVFWEVVGRPHDIAVGHENLNPCLPGLKDMTYSNQRGLKKKASLLACMISVHTNDGDNTQPACQRCRGGVSEVPQKESGKRSLAKK